MDDLLDQSGLGHARKNESHITPPGSEVIAALLLQRLPGFGASSYWKLRRLHDSNSAILHAPFSQLTPILKDPAIVALKTYRNNNQGEVGQQLQRDLDWMAEHEVEVILFEDQRYPALLKNIDVPPPLLFVSGDINNLFLPQLAVVGSRNPTTTGSENAFEFSRALAATGFAITSGMALGIDAAAHRGAIRATGKTIAVFGTGIDKIYPYRHKYLASEILDSGGTLVSEYPLGTAPHSSHFPRRNRIISGLSLGVLVVEAAVKSGSLITAKYALQQGREVFAIPGSIHNPLSRGCHAIIRDGAMLVEQVQDLQEPLQGLMAFKWKETFDEREPCEDENESTGPKPKELQHNHTLLNAEETEVWRSLGYEAIGADTVCSRAQLDMGRVLSILINLELKGMVEQSADGYMRVGQRGE